MTQTKGGRVHSQRSARTGRLSMEEGLEAQRLAPSPSIQAAASPHPSRACRAGAAPPPLLPPCTVTHPAREEEILLEIHVKIDVFLDKQRA